MNSTRVCCGFGVGHDLVTGQRLAGHVLPGGVADHSGEIADQEDHLVAQHLELAQFVDQHGVAEVQIRRGRIETGLDHQRATGFQLFDQFAFYQDLDSSTEAMPHLLSVRFAAKTTKNTVFFLAGHAPQLTALNRWR